MRTKIARKLTGSIAATAALIIGLCINTLALTSKAVVEFNLFDTGRVKIDLNGGSPVIDGRGFLIEPGMTICRDFFIKNQSTDSVYCKIYFENVAGGLAEVLQITISDKDTILYQGTAEGLARKSAAFAGKLRVGERRELTASFYFPKESGNDTQDLHLTFDLRADAVQTKNNPNRLFD